MRALWKPLHDRKNAKTNTFDYQSNWKPRAEVRLRYNVGDPPKPTKSTNILRPLSLGYYKRKETFFAAQQERDRRERLESPLLLSYSGREGWHHYLARSSFWHTTQAR